MYLLQAPCSSSTCVHSSTLKNPISSASRSVTLRPQSCVHSNNKLHHKIPVAVPIAVGLLLKSSHARRTSVAVKAQQGPDKGSVAALEAALAAINNILGTYNRVRGPGKAGKQQGTGSNRAEVSGIAAGPSKLISFSAKASGSVPVKEVLKAAAAQQPISSSSCNDTAAHSRHPHGKHHQHNSSSKAHKHHKHNSSNKHKIHSNSSTNSSWLQQLTGKHPSSTSDSCDRNGQQLPAEALERSLQAYLALPLEQYSVLDPKLITRLPPGLDVEVFLEKLLAAQQARRAENKAARQQQQQLGLDAMLAAGEEGSSSSSSGTSLDPSMKELPVPAGDRAVAAVAGNATSSSNGTDSSSGSGSNSSVCDGSTSSSLAAAAAAAAAESNVLPADGAGAFLLRIPMKELLGVDLEPLLVIYVDIDPKNAQVTFCTNRLVIGDPRFDQEFKVDLIAKMSSKVQQAATLIADANPAAAGDGGSTSSANGNGSTTATVQHQDAAAAGGESSTSPGSSSSRSANSNDSTASSTAAETAAAAGSLQPVWQRNSSLSCKVKLSMTLRLPHPLSIVPGPLLSTTASLVAKLVMQALLPSFLELLATDYGRWASGSSTAARQALPAGSLVAAGTQQLQQVQQQQGQPEEGEKKETVSSN